MNEKQSADDMNLDVTDPDVMQEDMLPSVSVVGGQETPGLAPDWITSDMITSMERCADLIPRWRAALNKVILQALPKDDWVTFDGKHASIGNVAVQSAIPMMAGFKIESLEGPAKKESDDDVGKKYMYEYRGVFSFAGKRIVVIGSCDSRQKFFARSHGSWRQLSDINEVHIIRAAYNACIGGAIKMFLGITRISCEQIAGLGLNITPADQSNAFKPARPAGAGAPASPPPVSPPVPPPADPYNGVAPTRITAPISDAQRKRMWAIAMTTAEARGYPNNRDYAKATVARSMVKLGIKSNADVNRDNYESLCIAIERDGLEE